MLDFARLERGQASFEFAVADLGARSVTASVELSATHAARAYFRLPADVAGGLAALRASTSAPMQLPLFNLDNAFKHAGNGATVTVRLRGDAQRLSLEVEDEGPGIDPDDARRIFERFYQRPRGAPGRRGLGHHSRAGEAHRVRARRRRSPSGRARAAGRSSR
ncbi:MAG: ATP-binding protein [Polyangiales bacterium]